MSLPFPEMSCPPSLVQQWTAILQSFGLKVVPDEPLDVRIAKARLAGLDMPDPSDEEVKTLTSVACYEGEASVHVASQFSDRYGGYIINVFPLYAGESKLSWWRRRELRKGCRRLAEEVCGILMEHGAKPVG